MEKIFLFGEQQEKLNGHPLRSISASQWTVSRIEAERVTAAAGVQKRQTDIEWSHRR